MQLIINEVELIKLTFDKLQRYSFTKNSEHLLVNLERRGETYHELKSINLFLYMRGRESLASATFKR